MPRIRSDDNHLKLRAIWLGPRGWTLPFEWTYARWLLSAITGTLAAFIVYQIVSAGSSRMVGAIFAVTWGIPAGVWIAGRIAAGASFDEPITYRIMMMINQVMRRGRPVSDRDTRIALTMPSIGEMSDGAARAMGWAPTTTTKEPPRYALETALDEEEDPDITRPRPRRAA